MLGLSIRSARVCTNYSARYSGIAWPPLYGIPFVVKDNMDVEGVPTTVGCKEYAYTPNKTAKVIQKLLDAG